MKNKLFELHKFTKLIQILLIVQKGLTKEEIMAIVYSSFLLLSLKLSLYYYYYLINMSI